jgi:cytochrome c553
MMKIIRMTTLAMASGCMLLANSAQAGDAGAGKAKSESCAQCHGDNGKDDPPIAGMAETDFTKALKAFQSGERKNKKMAKAATGLSDADIADLAAYYASLK